MAGCLNCGVEDQPLDDGGVCLMCVAAIGFEAQSRQRVMQESIELVDTSKSLSTQISRCRVILDHAQAMKVYEDRGIDVLEPKASEIIEIYEFKLRMFLMQERIVGKLGG